MDATDWLPAAHDIPALRSAASDCQGCELWEPATQTVFSGGNPDARLMLVGEQPGDQEDQRGIPFVGPAGQVLQDALAAAGIDRGEVYVTNAVKHFRFEPRGKRRIHQKPELRHIAACHPWLEAETATVDPQVVVLLGATAGRAVLGRAVRIGAERGRLLEGPDGRPALITTHPSALLRLPDKSDWDEAFGAFVADLRLAATAEATGRAMD